MATFTFKDSYKIFYKIDPQIAGEELERIKARHDGLTAKLVVAEARPEDAPLHCAFEWRDEVAGERYREHQARNLFKAVEVVEPEGPRPVYVAVPAKKAARGEENKYRDILDVVQNVDYTASALQVLNEKLAGAQRALADFQRVAGQSGTETAAMVALAALSIAVARDAIARIH